MRHEDQIVGAAIRKARRDLNLTQAELAKKIGVKFQQLQKYETAGNRVSASRLVDIARALGLPIDYFFGNLDVTDTDEPLSVSERRLVSNYRVLSAKDKQSVKTIISSLTGGTNAA